MENIRNYEIMWLHGLNQFLPVFVGQNKMTLIDSYKYSRTNQSITFTTRAIDSFLFYSTTSLINELLVLVTENYNSDGFNLTAPQFKKFLTKSKELLPQEYKNMNGSEFLKAIRDSIAHNSIDVQNLEPINLESYNVVIRKKGASLPAKKTLTVAHLHQILKTYDECRNLEKIHGCLEFTQDISSLDEVLKLKKKLGSFNKFMTFKNVKNEVVVMDEYQESALLRFLLKNKATINKSKDPIFYIMRYYPNKDNKFNTYENKFHFLSVLKSLYGCYGATNQDVLRFIKENKINAQIPFIDTEYLKALISSSIAFGLFSSRTNEEIYELAKNTGITFDQETVRHMRNAFVHGRYFYNYKQGFEFYDGKNELQHYGTLNIDDLEKMMLKATNEEIAYVYKRREEIVSDTFNEILNGNLEK